MSMLSVCVDLSHSMLSVCVDLNHSMLRVCGFEPFYVTCVWV